MVKLNLSINQMLSMNANDFKVLRYTTFAELMHENLQEKLEEYSLADINGYFDVKNYSDTEKFNDKLVLLMNDILEEIYHYNFDYMIASPMIICILQMATKFEPAITPIINRELSLVGFVNGINIYNSITNHDGKYDSHYVYCGNSKNESKGMFEIVNLEFI